MRATRSVTISPEVLANERFAHCVFCGERIRHSGQPDDVWRHIYPAGDSVYQFYTYCKKGSGPLAEPEHFQVRLV